jgi:predicted amidohydrolase YtcJ
VGHTVATHRAAIIHGAGVEDEQIAQHGPLWFAAGPAVPGSLRRCIRCRCELNRVVALLDKRGLQVTIHAIGDRAIRGYTSWAAYASLDEQRKGTLAPGMLADIAVLSGDVFTQPPKGPEDIKVAATIFDGRVVYTRP